jgi:hypothetical protein
MKSYPWADRLIEVALKSLLELQTEFSLLPIGQEKLRQGHSFAVTGQIGFQIIDERHLCAKILQNAINSPLFSGSYQTENKKKNIKAGFRFWNFYREFKYRYQKKYCDIILDRVDYDGKEIKEFKEPVYIEAKRIKLDTIKNLSKGKTYTVRSKNYKDCFLDIKKLIAEKEYTESKRIYNKIFCHLLVWGDSENPEEDNVEKVESYLKNKMSNNFKNYTIRTHNTRWFPIDSISEFKLSADYKIKRWGWVALLEIGKIGSKKSDDDI